jgi:dimethylamine/trimethylamine dehydrogenase
VVEAAMDDRTQIISSPAAGVQGRPSRYDVLFDQIRIGPKVMRNRFYQTPHCTSFGVQRPGGQARLRGVKAEGGWAVVNTEYCSIHPESDDSPWVPARLWDESDVRNLSAMTDAVHEHGSLAGVQLWYGGVVGTNLETRLPARGVSPIPSDDFPAHSCYEMTTSEIRELQDFYVTAAHRAVAAGFDIVIVGAQEVDNVLAQFLMRFYNHRRDSYGGSLENRARFLLETVERVRAEVCDSCAVAIRLCVDTLDGTDRGIRAEVEGGAVIEMADHLVDYWDVQVGGWGSRHWNEDAKPSRFAPENFQGPWINKVRSATAKPLVGTGRFTSPDTMVNVIRGGQQDIIGAARPSIADPFLPKKIEEGRFDDLRECIGCNICVARFDQSSPIVCTQNPTMGEEYRRGWHPERVPRARNSGLPVLIVGAGPAGLECAMTLGRRGFEHVHVVDAADGIGGSMRWIPRLPGLAEWSRVVDYRQIQLEKLANVAVIPRKKLDVDRVLDYGGAIVIVATGARWARDGMNWATHEPIRGVELQHDRVLTPEEIAVESKGVAGEQVVIYDCDGYFMGVSLAERLRGEDRRVTLVTPFTSLAPYMEHTYEAGEMGARLEAMGVEQVLGMVIDEVGIDAVSLSRVVKGDCRTEIAADAVVLVTQRVANDGLYRELEKSQVRVKEAGIQAVYRIGDCAVPRITADVIFDGHRLAREIDTEDPSKPLPFIRENLVLGDDAEHGAAAVGYAEASRGRPALDPIRA